MEIENVRRLWLRNHSNSSSSKLRALSIGSFNLETLSPAITLGDQTVCALKSSYSGNSDRSALHTAPWQPWPAISPLVGIRKLVKYLAIKLLQQNFGLLLAAHKRRHVMLRSLPFSHSLPFSLSLLYPCYKY